MQVLRDDEFLRLSHFTKTHYGIDLSQKRAMVEGRLQSFLPSRGYRDFEQYYQCLMNDRQGQEAAELVNRLSTNYTFFMRETNHFDYFREHILPHLAATVKNRDLRIWSAGCSSGEEPYTLAMIVSDFFGPSQYNWDTRILATDISSEVLEIGLRATYNEEQVKPLPERWKLQYLEPSRNGQRRFVKAIREGVIFKKFNLMEKQFPFKQQFHVIFCRNVMIYFDRETKLQLIERMYQHTAAGGYLIIGHSESIDRKETGYQYVLPAVYRKE